MTYAGHVESGTIILDEAVVLGDGTRVQVVVVDETPQVENLAAPKSLADRWSRFIGAAEGMPEDWSENHDQYLREEYRQ